VNFPAQAAADEPDYPSRQPAEHTNLKALETGEILRLALTPVAE
jgi:hypothetical protein